MPWISAKYRFASTFSYRLPNFSSSYALCAPTPSPSTIKLAITSEAISRSGNVEKGKKIFKEISNSKITFELPNRIAIFKAFIKRLKQTRQGEGFDRTFGIREYVHYNGPLGIYIEISEKFEEKIISALKTISYFGTSDSICTCIETLSQSPKDQYIREYDPTLSKNGVIFLLTDFADDVNFENIDPYSSEKITKHILTKPFFFPLKAIKKESNYVIYEKI